MCQFFLRAALPCCIWNSAFGYQCNILSPEKFVAVTCGRKEENGEVKVVPQEGFVPFVLRGLKEVP
jgi:hypothetical protein